MVMLTMVTHCECGHVPSDKVRITESEGKGMAEFKVGDRVRLAVAECMGAPVGAEATVVGHKNRWVTVEWDHGRGVVHAQMDGNYSPDIFELAEPRKDTPAVGDTVRVVLEGKVTYVSNYGFDIADDNTIAYDAQEHVKSVEIITPAKPSASDLPVGTVIHDDESGLVLVRRGHDTWRATSGFDYADDAVDTMTWIQLVPKGSE